MLVDADGHQSVRALRARILAPGLSRAVVDRMSKFQRQGETERVGMMARRSGLYEAQARNRRARGRKDGPVVDNELVARFEALRRADTAQDKSRSAVSSLRVGTERPDVGRRRQRTLYRLTIGSSGAGENELLMYRNWRPSRYTSPKMSEKWASTEDVRQV